MKKIFFALVFTLIFLPVLALAQFKASLLFEPDSWPYNTTQKVAIIASNDPASKQKLTKIEIYVPQENNVSIYFVEDDFTLPAKWTYSLSYRAGKVYLITFESKIGIEPGESAKFIMNKVRAPEKIGEYEWNFVLISEAEEKIEGTIKTFASYGKLAKFEIEDVPSKIRAGKSFKVKIIAYDEFGNLKEDYVGEITIDCSDENATFPKSYKFEKENKGVAEIEITYRTKGLQRCWIYDKVADVFAKFNQTNVLPAIPINLKIEINFGKEYTGSEDVILSLQAENAEECRYSNDGVIWSEYEPYSEVKEWKLIAGEGTRIVYYQCKNAEGESEVVYDSIELRKGIILPIPLSYVSYAALILSIIALFFSFRQRAGRKREE